ncbi:LysM peptidoglycan-binding domain-containing protein [uncultured Vagococcus sp.]|uniref:LysM peptidoglycan-binding domain-containing protein n=1 Tax=uncultured Vagococcus sp. TaxID=189676 RepID=UPI0028D0DBE3|nr:LysM peptidoglycan-binding domain-containing protein [uncultured Vagococcus sp.]
MNEEELEQLSTDDVTLTRASRSQARVMTANHSSDNGGAQRSSGNGILTIILVLFLVVLTAGMSFLIYVTLGNEKKYDAMEEKITAIEQRLPNTGEGQESPDQSKLLQPTTNSSGATTSSEGVGTEPSSGVAQPNPNGTKTYIVQSGDTLSAIAAITGMTIDDLRSINELVDDNLYEGQVLNVKAEAIQ